MVFIADWQAIDATYMSKAALNEFLLAEIADAKTSGILFSLHMKANNDEGLRPDYLWHAVRAFFKNVFETHGDALEKAGVDVTGSETCTVNSTYYLKVMTEILAAIDEAYAAGPSLAMVDSDRGITNLHVPSDVIIDASMPAMIRSSGKMWNLDGKLQDESNHTGQQLCRDHEEVIFCKANGASTQRQWVAYPT